MTVAVYNPDSISVEVIGNPAPLQEPPPSSALAPADFATRSTAAGVVRAFDFSQPGALGMEMKHADVYYQYGNGANGGNFTKPSIDNGTLKLTLPSQSGQNGGGFWVGHFSPTLDPLFGENVPGTNFNTRDEFWLQYRTRYSQAALRTAFRSNKLDTSGNPIGGAMKSCFITASDTPLCPLYPTPDPDGALMNVPVGKSWSYCEKTEIIIDRAFNHPNFIVYNECGAYRGFYQPSGTAGAPSMQNAMPGQPACLLDSASMDTGNVAGCWQLLPDEWITVKARVKLGPRDRTTRRFTNSEFQLWLGHEGQPTQLVLDWRPGVPGYFPLCDGTVADPQWYGKVVLTTYMTNKDITQVHPDADVWFKEVVVSTQDIADPL